MIKFEKGQEPQTPGRTIDTPTEHLRYYNVRTGKI